MDSGAGEVCASVVSISSMISCRPILTPNTGAGAARARDHRRHGNRSQGTFRNKFRFPSNAGPDGRLFNPAEDIKYG